MMPRPGTATNPVRAIVRPKGTESPEADGPRRRKIPSSRDPKRSELTVEAQLEIHSREDLRRWLSANHETSPSIWLVTYKRHHEHYIPYATFVEELLCWGWIDSVKRAIDADRVSCRVSRRNPKSPWSAVNKAHVLRARSSGAMTPAGEAAISAALENGAWTELDEVDAGVVPPDLQAALTAAGAAAQGFWDCQPRGVQWLALRWIKSAKTSETRRRRVADVAESAAVSLRPTPQLRSG